MPTLAQSQSTPVTQFKSNGLSNAPSVLTYTVFIPLVFKFFPVHFTLVGYNCCGSEQFEHVHMCDSSGAMTDISSWRIHSVATGDDYYFPSGAKVQNCTGETTLNTRWPDNVDNVKVFNWLQPDGRDEWPNGVGVTYTGYLYNSAGQLVYTCKYTPSPSDGGTAPCQ